MGHYLCKNFRLFLTCPMLTAVSLYRSCCCGFESAPCLVSHKSIWAAAISPKITSIPKPEIQTQPFPQVRWVWISAWDPPLRGSCEILCSCCWQTDPPSSGTRGKAQPHWKQSITTGCQSQISLTNWKMKQACSLGFFFVLCSVCVCVFVPAVSKRWLEILPHFVIEMYKYSETAIISSNVILFHP